MKKADFKARFKKWNAGETDLLENVAEHREGAEYIFDRTKKFDWEHHPIKRLEQMEMRSYKYVYPVLAVVFCAIIICILLYTVSHLPYFGDPGPADNEVSERYISQGMEETGAVNVVAGVILDYRAFDTLGESHVLFTAASAVLILLLNHNKREKRDLFELHSDVIFRTAVRILTPIIILFGIYIILNGHLSPGGGFSGGAIIGAGLILYTTAFGFKRTEKLINKKSYSVITVTALLFYSFSKCYSFFTGANHLDSIISAGTPGKLFSAGLILPLNIAVGIVVACTMYGFFSLFRRGRI